MYTFANNYAFFVFVMFSVIQRVDVNITLTEPEIDFPFLGGKTDNKEQWICDVDLDCSPNPDIVCCETCQCNFNCSGSKEPCCNGTERTSVNDIVISKYHCSSAEYLSVDDKELSGENYLLVAACKTTETNKTLIDFCFNTESTDDIFKKLPVTSDMGLSYRNRFCALCNNITRFTYWKAKVKCINKQIYGRSLSDIVDQVRFSGKQCNILFSPGPNVEAKTCKLAHECYTFNSMVMLPETCTMQTSIYDTEHQDGKLTNRPCFKCDLRDDLCNSPFTGFSALLNFNDQSTSSTKINENKCGSRQIYDKFTDSCLLIDCIQPGVIRNDSCANLYETVSGSSHYEVFVRLDIVNSDDAIQPSCTKCVKQIMSDISSKLEHSLEPLKLQLCDMNFYFKIKQSNHTDENSLRIVSIIVRERFYVSSKKSHNYIDSVSKLISFVPDKFNTTVLENDIRYIVFVDSRVYTPVYILEYKSYVDPYDDQVLLKLPTLISFIHAKNWECYENTNWITVHKLRLCPYVNVTKETFKLKFQEQDICFSDVQLCIPPGQYIDHGERVSICLEKFKEFDRLYGKTIELTNDSDDIEEILSFTCTTLSVISLTIVTITYSVFKCLRTLPGYNTITLCIWMLLAHLLYQFGMQQTHLGVGCIILGLLAHFFWLQTFAWQTICCAHAYRVFARKNGMSFTSTSPRKTYMIYAVSSFIFAFVFISVNIGIKMVSSYQSDFGYGGKLCYISDQLMIAYTFALPLGLSVVINIFLILIVVIKIHRMPEIQKNVTNERNNMKIFVKLSTLTGLTWLFGFIYEWSENTVFLYIFVILTSLQGVFLMISFVFNGRILGLYTSLLFSKRKQKQPSRQSRSSSTFSSDTVSLSTIS